MKTSLNSLVLGSTLVLAAMLTGCGDDDSASGASCAQVCTKVEAAKCKNDPDCMDTCNTIKDSTPMGCTGSYSELTRCYAGAKFTCDADAQSVAKDCSKQETAYAKCRQSGGKDDAAKDAGSGGDTKGNSDAGMSANGGSGGKSGGDSCSGVTLDSACGQCLKTSCCDGLVACQNDPDCLTLIDCVDNCNDSSCVQTCADSASSSSVDLYNTFIDCGSNRCNSECTDTTSAGDAGASGSDVGAPNDGDGGHAGATTPPNCLDVPSDVTGYCEEVKYKAIYDCPDGPPYADCELNKVAASGIYCCGE